MAITDTGKLAAQLRVLLQLTQTEAQTAQVRVAQARTDAVRRELTENAKNAEKRTSAIAEQLRRLGGVPDVLTPAVGRVAALVKAGAEQAQPLPEGLLADLTLEHQLLDRARYVKVLAKTADEKPVVRLAERLETAHSATVEWLTTVLAEEALGGPAALRATPLQVAAGGAYRVAILPGRWTIGQLNKAADTVSRSREKAAEAVSKGRDEAREKAGEARGRVEEARGKVYEIAGKAAQISNSAGDIVSTGWNAALRRGEKIASDEGATDTAVRVHEARRDAGELDSDELPIKNYDKLSASAAVDAVKKLTKAKDVRAIVRYEESNKDRSTVVSAAQVQLARLAKEAVSSS